MRPWIGIAGLFVLSLIISAAVHSVLGVPAAGAEAAGYLAGGAFVTFLVAGIFPLVWWGFRRFRAERAAGPLVLWLALIPLVALASFLGQAAD